MKRLVVITVGKTHSGKTTFARALEKELNNSFVVDQDSHAEFINSYYKNLLPEKGPNTLKHEISRLIVEYGKKNTKLHFIICNANLRREDRRYLLEELFNQTEFFRILVHFDIPDAVLQNRVTQSERSTNIFRGTTSFEEILLKQQTQSLNEDRSNPIEGEADRLIILKGAEEVEGVIRDIVKVAEALK